MDGDGRGGRTVGIHTTGETSINLLEIGIEYVIVACHLVLSPTVTKYEPTALCCKAVATVHHDNHSVSIHSC
jgi:hypothetical protein